MFPFYNMGAIIIAFLRVISGNCETKQASTLGQSQVRIRVRILSD